MRQLIAMAISLVVFVVFVFLKLFGVVGWSWWLVFFPLVAVPALIWSAAILLIVCYIILVGFGAVGDISVKNLGGDR